MKLSGKINSREFISEVRELVYVIFQASSAPRQKQGARRRFVGGPKCRLQAEETTCQRKSSV